MDYDSRMFGQNARTLMRKCESQSAVKDLAPISLRRWPTASVSVWRRWTAGTARSSIFTGSRLILLIFRPLIIRHESRYARHFIVMNGFDLCEAIFGRQRRILKNSIELLLCIDKNRTHLSLLCVCEAIPLGHSGQTFVDIHPRRPIAHIRWRSHLT